MKDWLQGFEIFSTTPYAIAVAIIACIAKQAFQGWQGFVAFVRKLIVCIFVGMILGWCLEGEPYTYEIKGAIIGGGAFASDTIIEPLLRKIVSLINNWHGSIKERNE